MRPTSRAVAAGVAAVGLLLVLLISSPAAAASTALKPPSPVPAAEGPGPRSDTLRTLQPEDLFRLHRPGPARFSPDGRRVAFRWSRSGEEGKVDRLALRPVARSDVWVARVGTGQARPITDGGETGTGWFRPRWSPDGERLALLSLRGNRVTPWIWNASTDSLRRLTDRAVHRNGAPLVYRWRSDRELVLSLRPEGAADRGRRQAEGTRPGLFAIRRWREAWSGREVTADVLSSGMEPVERERRVPVEIRVIDVAEGTARTLAVGRWTFGRVSPDGRWLATFRHRSLTRVPQDRPPARRGDLGSVPGAVELTAGVGADGRDAATGDEQGIDAGSDRAGAPRHGTLRWAPDGHAYAFLTRLRPEGERPQQAVVRYQSATGERELIGHPARRVGGLAWSGDSELLVRTLPPRRGGRGRRPSVRWWKVAADGSWELWSGEMERAPGRLFPAPEGGAVGVAGGELWRLDGGAPRRLTADFEPPIRRVVWPNPARFAAMPSTGRDRRPDGPVVVSTGGGSSAGLWTVELAGPGASRFESIPVPSGAAASGSGAAGPATPRDVAPGSGAAVFSAADERGTRVWLARSGPGEGDGALGSAVDTLIAADRWISEVEAGEARKLTYRGASGRQLTAWAILPPDHREGERHPTVVVVYPGAVRGDRKPPESRVNMVSPWSALQLLASEGYAVLLPSMPLRGGGDATRRERMDDGVLPAVEKAVEAGIADSARTGLLGHSYGGHAVYQLVSMTDRFDAAVASAGFPDLGLQYGAFDDRAAYRHMRHPLEALRFQTYFMERGQGGMGAPPWEAPERWRANDPIRYVDQVETPLMMLHGDRDFVNVEGAEAFFTALHRQDKPARLVRYFGEGHVLRGRANVLDMFDRLVGWFDRHLLEADPPPGE